MSNARPAPRSSVDFPPWFAPVITSRDRPPACTSLPMTLRPMRSTRDASRSPSVVRPVSPTGSGHREAELGLLAGQFLVQDQAADVEAQFGIEHPEERDH